MDIFLPNELLHVAQLEISSFCWFGLLGFRNEASLSNALLKNCQNEASIQQNAQPRFSFAQLEVNSDQENFNWSLGEKCILTT
jgi:hypothetical protein